MIKVTVSHPCIPSAQIVHDGTKEEALAKMRNRLNEAIRKLAADAGETINEANWQKNLNEIMATAKVTEII
jgi:hypothetical protein